ncbi:MAG: histidinol dehydrogenase [Rhodospirillales bacterium]|nr:histidinol dehydrogenase [Alphaproteobacteria bacterium]USO04091.1 MAG: histidinol dehydrogenase [Rhodospirillales bacterium]
MKIGFYKWSETDNATKARILQRSGANIDALTDQIRPIIENVRQNGESALIQYAKQFDHADLSCLKVSEDELKTARATLDPDLKAAIDHCAGNVRRFHEEQMRRVEREWFFEVEPGVLAGEKVTPISSVGLYVPGGKNQYPSAVYMLGIPAVLAGVEHIVMTTPPRPDGTVGNALLYAAQISGIRDVYKVGGAQAIAALAYGTENIPAVKKVLGPGSPYVAAAKQLLSGEIDPGMPAGPSESIILCDESADPHNTVLDILNEAEHGPDSAALLVTHDEKLANYALNHLPEAILCLPEPQKGWIKTNMEAYSGIILTKSLEESINFANIYATEHLLLKVKAPETVLPQLKNAGEILIGENTPSSLGNYGIGVNHVLPTNGKAHSYSCTSVWDFLKRTSLARVSKEGLETLAGPVTALTDYEGFPAHGEAVRSRKKL